MSDPIFNGVRIPGGAGPGSGEWAQFLCQLELEPPVGDSVALRY